MNNITQDDFLAICGDRAIVLQISSSEEVENIDDHVQRLLETVSGLSILAQSAMGSGFHDPMSPVHALRACQLLTELTIGLLDFKAKANRGASGADL